MTASPGTDAALRPASPEGPRSGGAPIHRRLASAWPSAVAVALFGAGWEAVVHLGAIPPYVLPPPSLIGATLVRDWSVLFAALLVTLRVTATALLFATLASLALALAFSRHRWLERALFPFAVTLQVTPVVAVAPLLLVYLEPATAVLVCAGLVAFFPILSNTMLGLAAADPGLLDLTRLYGATRWQEILFIRLPSALPHLLGGLRIGGGLALIGAVVAEMAAGTAGRGAGLAFRIVEAGFRLNIPRMYAALALIAAAGLVLNGGFALLSRLLLRDRDG